MLDQDPHIAADNIEPIGPELSRGPYPAALEETIAGLRAHLGKEIAHEAAETLRRMFDRANRWTRQQDE
jgi:hypothetical protein